MTHDEFLALLAHELRGPVAALTSAAEVIASPALAARDREEAREVLQRQSQRLAGVLDEVLELGRLMGRPAPAGPRVDLVALLQRHRNVELSGTSRPVWVAVDAALLDDAIARAGAVAASIAREGENDNAARVTLEPGGGLAMQFVRVLLEAGGAHVRFERGATGRRLVARLG